MSQEGDSKNVFILCDFARFHDPLQLLDHERSNPHCQEKALNSVELLAGRLLRTDFLSESDCRFGSLNCSRIEGAHGSTRIREIRDRVCLSGQCCVVDGQINRRGTELEPKRSAH